MTTKPIVNENILRLFMNDSKAFKRAYLSGTSQLIVNYVKNSKSDVKATDVAKAFKISIQHASTVMARMNTLGYFSREQGVATSGGTEYLYRYAL